MAQIQETQCVAATRKDCSSKKTCQLRHSNEEVGKDLMYYTRKFDRTTEVLTREASPESSLVVLPVSNFIKETVKGDGHCIIHSILSLLVKKGVVVPSKEDLLNKLREALLADLEHYAPFIDVEETDPIQEIDAFVNNACYNSGIVDLVIPLVAKILNVGLVVMELDGNGTNYVTSHDLMYPSHDVIGDDALHLLKSGMHYDPLHNISTDSASVSVETEEDSSDPPVIVETTTNLEIVSNDPPVTVNLTDLETSAVNLNTGIVEDEPDTTTFNEEVSVDPLLLSESDRSNVKFPDTTTLGSNLEPERILASLCANAPDYHIRDCLRKYSCEHSLKRQTNVFNSFNKPVLEKTAAYLKIVTSNLKKPEIIHSIICKIQNLLPDTCQICNESYVSEINDPPFLACELCGQEVHKSCFMQKLGLMSIDGLNAWNLINPLQLPGIHFFCLECEKDIIPGNSTAAFPPLSQVNSTSKTVLPSPPQPSASTYSEVLLTDSSPPSTICDQTLSVDNKALGGSPVSSKIDSNENCHSKVNKSNGTSSDNNRGDKPKVKNCVFFMKNQCKHGLKGTNCPFLHPERCSKLLQHGTKSPNGCNLGKKCAFFHPEMCPSSVSKRACFDGNCQFVHVKGTKRIEQPSGNKLQKTTVVTKKTILVSHFC